MILKTTASALKENFSDKTFEKSLAEVRRGINRKIKQGISFFIINIEREVS